jgi:hypothetical protein
VARSPLSSDPSVSADATALPPSEVAAAARLAFFRIFFFWFLERPPFADGAGTLGVGSSVLAEGRTKGTPDFRGSFEGSMAVRFDVSYLLKGRTKGCDLINSRNNRRTSLNFKLLNLWMGNKQTKCVL